MHDTYTLLRHFADSWMLLALFGVFSGVILWAYRPGSREIHDDAARAIFREDAADPPVCGRGCPDCTCATLAERSE